MVRYGFGFEQFPMGRLQGGESLIDRPEELLSVV
jgi:hypothetical protein